MLNRQSHRTLSCVSMTRNVSHASTMNTDAQHLSWWHCGSGSEWASGAQRIWHCAGAVAPDPFVCFDFVCCMAWCRIRELVWDWLDTQSKLEVGAARKDSWLQGGFDWDSRNPVLVVCPPPGGPHQLRVYLLASPKSLRVHCEPGDSFTS